MLCQRVIGTMEVGPSDRARRELSESLILVNWSKTEGVVSNTMRVVGVRSLAATGSERKSPSLARLVIAKPNLSLLWHKESPTIPIATIGSAIVGVVAFVVADVGSLSSPKAEP